jgi:hypothetical protein
MFCLGIDDASFFVLTYVMCPTHLILPSLITQYWVRSKIHECSSYTIFIILILLIVPNPSLERRACSVARSCNKQAVSILYLRTMYACTKLYISYCNSQRSSGLQYSIYLGEKCVQTVHLLSLLHKGIILCHSFQSQFFHQVDFIWFP